MIRTASRLPAPTETFPDYSTNLLDRIGEHQITDEPYTFKQVSTPLANRNISISDEEQSFESQGLLPSATLILIPVQGYASAYENADHTGLVSRTAFAGYSVVSSVIGAATAGFRSLLGGNSTPVAQDGLIYATPAGASAPNVRTLGDQDRSEDHQFYNGNAVRWNESTQSIPLMGAA